MSQDMTTLLATITALQSRLEALEAQPKAKKAVVRHGRPEKAYAGLSGLYFELPIDNTNETHVAIQAQVQKCLDNPEYLASLTKMSLGRAILQFAQETGRLIFWAPNQEHLMFGPARHGAKTAAPSELFQIPMSTGLIQLGSDIKDSAQQVSLLVQLDAFVYQEKQKAFIAKLEEKLHSLKPKKK